MSIENSKANFYIIPVKKFGQTTVKAPLQGTKAYTYPWIGSTVSYTFPAPSSTKYSVDSLVFCGGDYWAHFINLGSAKKSGYVNCFEIGFNYTQYADPSMQTPNSNIGTNTSVIFNMWYFPTNSYIGVKYAIPLYYQFYYINGTKKNSLKCTLLSSISGYYLYEGKYYDPTTYLNDMTKKYWGSSGINMWIANMARTASKDSILKKAKSNLNSNKPFLVGAQNDAGTPHMVLVTGYKNSGANFSDYIVLDSIKENFSNLEAFFASFPNPPGPGKWDSIGGTGYVYGEY